MGRSETLEQRLIPWVRAETMNGRGVLLREVAERYDISLAEAGHLIAGIKEIAYVAGVLRWVPLAAPLSRRTRSAGGTTAAQGD